MRPRPLLALLALACCCLPRLPGGEEPQFAPLFDIEDHIQALAEDNLELRIKIDCVVAGGVDLKFGIGKGTWLPGTGRAGSFNKAGHTCRAGDDLKSAGGKITGTVIVTIKPDQWVPADKQEHDVPCTVDLAIDKDTGDPRKWTVSGTVKGKLLGSDGKLGADHEGKVTGAAVLPVSPGYFNMGEWADGLKVTWDLGTRRVNWNKFAAVRHGFAEPQDWTEIDGLRITAKPDKPRADAALTLWVMEADGSWYYCQDAVPLIDVENSGIALFEDFTEAEWVCPGSHLDEDYTLDLAQVKEFAIGVVNPLGIGPVGVTVTAIDTVTLPAKPTSPAAVTVTGKTLAVNGHEMVPPGIFGGYAPNLPAQYRPGCQRKYFTTPAGGPTPARHGESFIIEMWGDRTHPATLLSSSNWRDQLAGAAKNYANKAKANPAKSIVEFWNEPYLDWAKGRNYNPKYFDQSKAVDGGEVTSVNYPGIIPHFKWKKVVSLRAKGKASGKIERARIPAGSKVGDTFKATVTVKKRADGKTRKVKEEREFEVVEQAGWKVVDETQFTYWSGKGNGFVYDEMAKIVGKTIKEISPDTKYIVGWGFRWCEDRWAAWEMLYQPTIENTIEWIDGCHEHHYQGDTTAMNGSYEVLAAYGMAKHGKWLHSYNTETNDLVDLPARGHVDTAEKAKAASRYKRLAYNMRDCLYCVYQSPDKFMSRTVIHCDHTKQATDIAYGMMAELRGRLVATTSSEEQVWCISSIDGTDPEAKRPDDLQKLVVFVWNDHRQEREIDVVVTAPTGTRLGAGKLEVVTLDTAAWTFGKREEGIAAPGAEYQASLKLPARRAAKLSFVLDGKAVDQAEVVRKQFFATDVLQPIMRGKPWATKVAIPADELAGTKRAWLRLVVESAAEGEALVDVAGTRLTIPRAVTGSNVSRIRELPLDLSTVKEEMPLTFSVAEGNFDGWLLDMASIVVEK